MKSPATINSQMAEEISTLKVEFTGRYKIRLDLQELAARDIKLASLLAAALMLLYLGFHFNPAINSPCFNLFNAPG